MPASGVRPRFASTPRECFRADASVLPRLGPAYAQDEPRACRRALRDACFAAAEALAGGADARTPLGRPTQASRRLGGGRLLFAQTRSGPRMRRLAPHKPEASRCRAHRDSDANTTIHTAAAPEAAP